jgi:hypothetical protein
METEMVNHLNEILLTIAILLQIGDGVTTWLCLRSPDRYEANKALKWLMDRIGVIPSLLLTKLAFSALLITGTMLYPSAYLTAILGIVCAGYAYVVWQNYRLLKL